jgi:type I restriction enzyme S subunit
MSVHFTRLFFETIIARNLSISSGTAIPNLSAQQINETVIGVPPLAEQHRIVAKVDGLMALCDRLEASLATSEDTRHRLLETLLREALPQDGERELEAAE